MMWLLLKENQIHASSINKSVTQPSLEKFPFLLSSWDTTWCPAVQKDFVWMLKGEGNFVWEPPKEEIPHSFYSLQQTALPRGQAARSPAAGGSGSLGSRSHPAPCGSCTSAGSLGGSRTRSSRHTHRKSRWMMWWGGLNNKHCQETRKKGMHWCQKIPGIGTSTWV